MDQLQLSHPLPQMLEMDQRVARFLEGEATNRPQAKRNSQCLAAAQASLQAIAERLKRLDGNQSLRRGAPHKSARMGPRIDAHARMADMLDTENLAARTARTSATAALSWTRTFLSLILLASPLCLTLAIVFVSG